MTRGQGSGWHRESRRHHDAAMKGRGPPREITRSAGYRVRRNGGQAVIKLNEAREIIDEEIADYQKAIDKENDLLMALDMEEYRDGLKEAASDLHFVLINNKTNEGVRKAILEGYRRAHGPDRQGLSMKNKGLKWAWTQAHEKVI